MNRRIFGFRWVLFVLLVWHIVGVFAQQPTPPNSYDGLDIIFLVDQSGSMGGRAYGFPEAGVGTDPLDLRFEAVQYALDTLGQYRLTLARDIPMRMAVVNFGDDISSSDLTRGWVEIAPTADQLSWDAARVVLQDEFSAATFRARNSPANLGNTNFAAAFTAAQQLFARLPQSTNQPHLRAIVLLTDGAPCVPAQFDCESLREQQRFFDLLDRQVADDFGSDDYRLYVLALDNTGSLWALWETRWQQITGTPERATRAENSQQVGVGFLNILVDLMGVVRGASAQDIQRLQPGQNTVILPPYLREVRVSIFKSTVSPGILTVTRPDGTSLGEDDSSLSIANRDRPIEVWSIRDPQPGTWVFDVGDTNDRIDVYLDLIPVEVQAIISGGTFIEGDDVNILLDLTDANNIPLIDYGGIYTPRIMLNLTQPDGVRSFIPFTRNPDGRYQAIVQSARAGLYQLGLEVSTQTEDGQTYIIFNRPDFSSFEVRGVAFMLELPQRANFLVGERVPLIVTLTDDSGVALTFPQIDVRAELTLNNISTLYPLEQIDAQGNYRTELMLNGAGLFTLAVNAIATREDGSTLMLAPSLTAQLAVQQSQLISLVRISPEEPVIEQETTVGIPPFTPNPLEVVVEVRVDDRPAPPLDAITPSGTLGWIVTVSQDGELLPVSAEMIEPVLDHPARYRLILPEVSTGEFNVTLALDGSLSGTYVYADGATSVSYTITRVLNPLYIASIAAIGLLVVLVVVFAVITLIRRRNRRRHPARGKLVIRREGDDAEYWSKQLDGLRSNYIIIRDSRLKKIGVARLIVTCTDSKMSQAKRVKVTAFGIKEPLFKDRVLSPGGPPVRLEKSAANILSFSEFEFADDRGDSLPPYALYKDPENTSFSLD